RAAWLTSRGEAGPRDPAGPSEAGEIIGRVDRGRSLAQLEVELGRVDVAGVAGLGDHLAALDGVAALDVEFAVVGVGADEAVRMLDQHQIAVALEPVAGIDDHPALGR